MLSGWFWVIGSSDIATGSLRNKKLGGSRALYDRPAADRIPELTDTTPRRTNH